VGHEVPTQAAEQLVGVVAPFLDDLPPGPG
jgi:hypothetical protein